MASLPCASAKWRTCLGFSSATGRFASSNAPSSARSSPPVASTATTASDGIVRSRAATRATPSASLANVSSEAESERARSSLSLATSTPT